MRRRFAGTQRLAALFALGCLLLVPAAAAAAASPTKYTPTVVAGVFKGAGIQLHVYTVSGQGPDAYTWLRPGVKCARTDLACISETARAQRLLVVVCPSGHAAARVASVTPTMWQTTTIGNVVVAYKIAYLYERPHAVSVAISRLNARVG